MTTPTAVCYRHPNRATGLSCSDCGRPICSTCSVDAAVGQKCPECLKDAGRQKIVHAGRGKPGLNTAGAPVTTAILAVTVAVFITGWIFPGFGASVRDALIQANWLVEAGEWWRVVTAALLHAGAFHLLFNMWALTSFGSVIERQVGSLPFLGLYLAGAAGGGVMAFHLHDRNTSLVGASGAIFGLIGLWLGQAYHARHTVRGRLALGQLQMLLLVNAIFPLLVPQVSWQGHLGGLLAGLLVGEIWRRLPSDRRSGPLRLSAALGVVLVAIATLLS